MINKAKIILKESKLFYFTKDLLTHPFFSGSAIMVVGTNFANFLAYIYHVVVGRVLEPAKYGELAATISLLGLFTVSFTFFSVVVVKFISAAREVEIERILSWFTKRATVLAITLGTIFFLFSSYISRFLHVDYKVVSLVGPILTFSVFTLVFRSVLQGRLKFYEVVISTNVEMLGRLILGVLLIYLGLSVFGAFLGILISVVLSLIVTRYFLREYRILGVIEKFSDGKKVFSYAAPIFLASLATNSFFSTDVILVKHFFEPHLAGIYASLSTLGKIIFFGASPVASVMFPMVSKRHSAGLSYKRIFNLSLLLTAGISVGVLFIYLFFPELAIKLLYGNKYIEAAPNLFVFGLFMTIFTISSLILNFYLSKSVTSVTFFAVGAAFLQALGIWFFHDSIQTVITVSIASASIFLVSMLIYFGYESKR